MNLTPLVGTLPDETNAMHPRTVAILVAAILLLSLGVRALVLGGALLPLTEEDVLKHATSLSVAYQTPEGQQKTLTITNPKELADLFSVLELRYESSDCLIKQGEGPGGKVTFHYPDGSRQQLEFASEDRLGSFVVNPRFYRGLCRCVSRVERRPIDRLDPENARPFPVGREGDVPPGPKEDEDK
jgi:hypothetical protein